MKKRILPEWNSYKRSVVPKNAPSVQIRESMLAFYAGAMSMFSIIKRISDKYSEDEGARRLSEVERELVEHAQAVERSGKVREPAPPLKSITQHGPGPVLAGTLEIDEYSLSQWCPTPDGTGPPEQLWLTLKLKGIDDMTLALRFKSRQAWDDLAAIGDSHADEIWPDGGK